MTSAELNNGIAVGDLLTDKIKESKRYANKSDQFEYILPYCKLLLEAYGWKVIPPMTFNYNYIKSQIDLVDFFYEKFKQRYPDKLVPIRDDSRDRKIAKDFIDAISSTGDISKKAALIQCAEIINFIIDNANDFNLVFYIGFKVLTQGDMAWVVEKAIGMLNTERDFSNSDYFDYLVRKSNAEYEGQKGFDIDNILKNMGEG